jgi:hypothetical protein
LQPQSIALLAINLHPTQELDRELYMGFLIPVIGDRQLGVETGSSAATGNSRPIVAGDTPRMIAV